MLYLATSSPIPQLHMTSRNPPLNVDDLLNLHIPTVAILNDDRKPSCREIRAFAQRDEVPKAEEIYDAES